MSDQRPSVGRMVHYTSHGSVDGMYSKECRTAIITEVGENGAVGLCVLNPTGLFFIRAVDHDGVTDPKVEPGPSGRPGGTWHWPEWT